MAGTPADSRECWCVMFPKKYLITSKTVMCVCVLGGGGGGGGASLD